MPHKAEVNDASLPPKPRPAKKRGGNKWGQIPKYTPDCCDVAVQMGFEGKSLAQIAIAFNISRNTLDNWRRNYPDFNEAVAIAQTAAQAHWEQIGQDNLENKAFNTAMWQKTMTARFKADYTERKELTGIDGGPLQSKTVTQIELIAAEPKTDAARDLATGVGVKTIEGLSPEVLDYVTEDDVALLDNASEDDAEDLGIELVAASMENHPAHEDVQARPEPKQAPFIMADVATKRERRTRRKVARMP